MNAENGLLGRRSFLGAAGLAITLLLGFVDYATGPDLGVLAFYLVPVVLCAWYGGRSLGITVSVFSAVTWVAVDSLSRHRALHPLLHVWNTLVAMVTLGVGAWLVARIRELLERESKLARTDPLTGVLNLRSFQEILENEVARCRRYRHPLSLAYLDLDGFKEVNDRFGHAVGDRLLKTTAVVIRQNLRETDVLARMGGDEFAILLPETHRKAALETLEKIHRVMRLRPQESGYTADLSVGLLTCEGEFPAAADMLRRADALMYEVKRGGRNGIRQASV